MHSNIPNPHLELHPLPLPIQRSNPIQTPRPPAHDRVRLMCIRMEMRRGVMLERAAVQPVVGFEEGFDGGGGDGGGEDGAVDEDGEGGVGTVGGRGCVVDLWGNEG